MKRLRFTSTDWTSKIHPGLCLANLLAGVATLLTCDSS